MFLDPSRDRRSEVAQASGVPDFDDKIWFHKTAGAVIEPGLCVGCGACVAACASGSIGIAEDGRPTLTRMCTGCSFCWDFCPLAGLRTDRITAPPENQVLPAGSTGPLLAAYEARARNGFSRAQDGGVCTALVRALLGQRFVDGALVTRRRDAFHGESVIVTAPEDLDACAGSVYHQTMPLALLSERLPEGVDSLAFVGTACQISTLHAIRQSPWRFREGSVDTVRVTIGLFCTRSFDPARLIEALSRRGISPSVVDRVDIRDGVLSVRSETQATAVGRASEFADASLRGCEECTDFTGRLADISLGNMGSRPGWTTALIRSEAGIEAWEAARPDLEVRTLEDLDAVEEAAERNASRAARFLPEESMNGSRWRSYTEHLRAYADTDKAPVAAPAHRSNHYQQSC